MGSISVKNVWFALILGQNIESYSLKVLVHLWQDTSSKFLVGFSWIPDWVEEAEQLIKYLLKIFKNKSPPNNLELAFLDASEENDFSNFPVCHLLNVLGRDFD